MFDPANTVISTMCDMRAQMDKQEQRIRELEQEVKRLQSEVLLEETARTLRCEVESES